MTARQCQEAITHGPADGRGRCPWCGVKYTSALPAPAPGNVGTSELSEAYSLAYDPDYGAVDEDQIRRRYQLGQNQ